MERPFTCAEGTLRERRRQGASRTDEEVVPSLMAHDRIFRMVIHPRTWSTKAIAMIVFPCGVSRRFGGNRDRPSKGDRERRGSSVRTRACSRPGRHASDPFRHPHPEPEDVPGALQQVTTFPLRISPHSEDAPGGSLLRSDPFLPLCQACASGVPRRCCCRTHAISSRIPAGNRGRSPRGTPTGCAPLSCARTEGRGATTTGRDRPFSTVSVPPDQKPAKSTARLRCRRDGDGAGRRKRRSREHGGGTEQNRGDPRRRGGRLLAQFVGVTIRSGDEPRARLRQRCMEEKPGDQRGARRKIPASVNVSPRVPSPAAEPEGIPLRRGARTVLPRASLRPPEQLLQKDLRFVHAGDFGDRRDRPFPGGDSPVWTMTSMAEAICSRIARSGSPPR